MKKIFIALLAVAALASCAKTEDVYTGENAEIKIKPAAALATKANVTAAINGTEYPTAENFDVYAYWNTDPAGSKFTDGTLYLGIDGPAVEFTNKGLYWGGKDETYYWPKNGSLRFAAYSPASVDMAHNLATDTYTATGYTQPSNTAKTWDLLVAPTSASYNSMTAAENVSVVFEHALSWITVKVVAKDADAAQAFDIKKVTINDVVTTADLAAVMTEAKTEDKMQWTLSDSKEGYVVFEGSQNVTLEPTVIETTTDGTIVIPQATTSITIDYTQLALPGTPQLDNQSVTVDLILDDQDTPWKAGKHYIYTLVFGLDEILINPDVADWEDVVVEDIDVDNAKVSTSKQLADAVKYDGKITLQEDIILDAPLTVAKNVALDLNGHDITYTSDVAASSAMITVTGSLIVRDAVGGGEIVYTYTGAGDNTFGWGTYTIVNNGTLTVEGGTIEMSTTLNGNGSVEHMHCAIQAGYGAKSTTIYGGTVKNETYRSIRVNQGTLTFNGGTMIGQVWMQPSNGSTSITIKGGSFQPMGVDGSSVFVTNDTYAVPTQVTGGTFATKVGTSVPTNADVKGSISGGTFANVTGLNEALIAEGYSVAKNGSVWDVVKGEGITAVADDPAEVMTVIKEENAVVSLKPDHYLLEGKMSIAKGVTIYGNGASLFNDWGSNAFNYQTTLSDVTIVDVNFSNNTIFDMAYAEGNLSFKDCIFSHVRGNQSIHFDGKPGAKVVFENCTFYGRNMYAASLDKVVFINCKFLESTWMTEQKNNGKADAWNGINMWGKYEFNGCEFAPVFGCHVKTNGVEATFNNCSVSDGSSVQDRIIVTSGVTDAQSCNIVVDGVVIY